MPSAQGHLTIMRKAKDGTDGMPGADGQPGEDAVRYWLTVNPESYRHLGTGQTVEVRRYLQVGSQNAALTTHGGVRYRFLSIEGQSNDWAWLDNTESEWELNINRQDANLELEYYDIYQDTSSPLLDSHVVVAVFNGEDGIQGCILRVSEWVSGIEYRNDSSLTTNGIRYLDIVVVTESATSASVYQCKQTHTASSGNKPGSGSAWEGYWTKFNNMAPIYTPLIMAQNALLRFTQTNQLLVMKSDGTTIAAGMGGGTYPLWVGASTPSAAPFRVNIDGKMYATDAEITGKVTATSGQIAGFTISGNSLINTNFDNNAYIAFRNNTDKKLVRIGGSAYASYTGISAVGCFENQEPADNLGMGTATNYGIVVSAQGADDNIAIYANGGSYACFAMRTRIISNTTTSTIYLDRRDFNVIAANSAQCYIYLPQLGIYDNGHVVRIRRIGSGGVTVYTQVCQVINDSGGTTGYYPNIYYNGNNIAQGSSGLSISNVGDSQEFVWIRDITVSTAKSVWIQYKFTRND